MYCGPVAESTQVRPMRPVLTARPVAPGGVVAPARYAFRSRKCLPHADHKVTNRAYEASPGKGRHACRIALWRNGMARDGCDGTGG